MPNTIQALPPVIDVEFYGDKGKNPPKRSKVQEELHSMVGMLLEALRKGRYPIYDKRSL